VADPTCSVRTSQEQFVHTFSVPAVLTDHGSTQPPILPDPQRSAPEHLKSKCSFGVAPDGIPRETHNNLQPRTQSTFV